MSGYRTEQKQLLTDFLTTNADRSYTVDEICESISTFAMGRTVPGRSTVYRLLTHLLEEGRVKRFVRDHGTAFAYQAVACAHHGSHLHLKCTDCGKLIHMSCEDSEALAARICRQCDFSVSEEETVLYGTCHGCKERKKESNV